jgi:hypothetical protein
VEQEQVPFWHVAPAPEPHWALDVQAPQSPAAQTEPIWQSLFELQVGVQIPEAQDSPVAQSLFTEHVHSNVVWVGVHCAFGPHWLFDVHAPQAPAAQTSLAGHWRFDEHPAHAGPLHATQAVYGWHIPNPAQKVPTPQSLFELHCPP